MQSLVSEVNRVLELGIGACTFPGADVLTRVYKPQLVVPGVNSFRRSLLKPGPDRHL